MGFLSELADIGADPTQQLGLFQRWLGEQPAALFAELRRDRPILVIAGRAVVSRYRDVVDVLSREREFGVVYGDKMHRATGDFFLGMNDGPAYEREVSIMRLAACRDDLPRLEAAIAGWADGYVAEQGCRGRLDVVRDLARRVPCRLVAEYFGIAGVDEATLGGWLRALFRDIFRNPGDLQPGVKDAAAAAARHLGEHLDGLIAQLAGAGGAAPADNVLARCVRLQASAETALDAAGIRRNIAGLIVGAVDTTSECVAKIVDHLLGDPALLAQATEIARNGTVEALRGHVFEALRFNPQATVLPRIALAPCQLGHGTAYATEVLPGTVVMAAVMSAMADADELDAPESFNPARPDRHYLHFGYGMHQCFGRHINRLQLPLIVRALLRLPGLRRAPGEEGQLRFDDGHFPDRLVVEFDAAG